MTTLLDPTVLWPWNPETQTGFVREPIEGIDYLSYSRLKALRDSPRHYWWRYVLKIKDEETPAKRRGTLIHKCVLETEDFLKHMRVAPSKEDYVETTKPELIEMAKNLGIKVAGTMKKDLILDMVVEKNPDLKRRLYDYALKQFDETKSELSIDLSPEEAELARHVIRSVQAHPRAMSLLQDGTPELTAYYQDPEFGVTWIVRLDYLKITKNRAWVVEVKSARSARQKEFAREVYDRAYYLQSWLYRRVVQAITNLPTRVIQVVVENAEPYCTETYAPHETQFETANWQVPRLIDAWKHGKETGQWLAYSDGQINELGLPNWATWDIEEQVERELNS
jgi:hypothetical protein